jgi:carboxylate-amine ligase
MPARALQLFPRKREKLEERDRAQTLAACGREAFTHRVPRRDAALSQMPAAAGGAHSLLGVIEQRFGESAPFSVGVEEEVMILDAETLLLSPSVELLIGESERLDLPGTLKMELFASVVELNTDICDSVAEAGEALAALRAGADRAARTHGLRIAATGSHPISPPEQEEIAPDPRYLEFVDYAGISARRQGVSGIHVHVGMASADDCFAALEGMLPWLPLVLALSANSPYLSGADSGHLSVRAQILAELPRAGAPPAFGSYAAWEQFVERYVALGLADGYTRFWWDIRPHPSFGTLEIRMPDQPTDLRLTIAFAALLQALAATALERPVGCDRGDYAQNRWAALHSGPRAQLIHPSGERLAGVPELTDELLELVRPAADAFETTALLEPLDASRCEADLQRENGREGLERVCAGLVERTLGSD